MFNLNAREQLFLDRLPPGARRRAIELLSSIADGSAFLHGARTNLLELRDKQKGAQAYYEKLIANPNVRATDAIAADARANIETLGRQIADLYEIVAQREAKFKPLAGLKSHVFDLIVPEGMIAVELGHKPPKIAKGQTISDAVGAVRAKRGQLIAETERVQSAPLPSLEAKNNWRKQRERLAASFRPEVFNAIERGGEVEFTTVPIVHDAQTVDGAPVISRSEGVDVVAAFAALFPAELDRLVESEIELGADDGNAMLPDDKAKALDRLAAEILALERDEAALIRQGAEAGLSIAFREDTNALAFFDISETFALQPKAEPPKSDQPKTPAWHGAGGALRAHGLEGTDV